MWIACHAQVEQEQEQHSTNDTIDGGKTKKPGEVSKAAEGDSQGQQGQQGQQQAGEGQQGRLTQKEGRSTGKCLPPSDAWSACHCHLLTAHRACPAIEQSQVGTKQFT